MGSPTSTLVSQIGLKTNANQSVIGAAAGDITWQVSDNGIPSDFFIMTLPDTDVEIAKACIVDLRFYATIEKVAGATASYDLQLFRDTGGGFALETQYQAEFTTGVTLPMTGSAGGILEVNANDVLKVRVIQSAGAGDINLLANKCGFIINILEISN